MRSTLVLLASIALLVGGFFIYFSLQTSSAPQSSRQEIPEIPAQLPPTSNPSTRPVGPGEDVWVKSYDDKTGDLAFQFRAARYDPKPDGSVDVSRPEAELFMGDNPRQVVRIEGATGQVVMASDIAQRGTFRASESSAPRRGVLNDVTITLYEEARSDRPLMRCRVNNIAFDNDTFRIATEGYEEAGRRVPADQVRVEVRGEDFDFDGRGLTIRWNDADRRLQVLEIAHGEAFTIKSPQLLQTLQRSPEPKAKQSRTPGNDVILARHVQAPPGSAETKTEKSVTTDAPKDLPPVYRANFLDSVRVTQGDEQIAAAEQMHVDFISDTDEPVSTKRQDSKSPTTRTAPGPRSTAAKQDQAPKPLVVRWNGRLRVTALEGDAPRPAPGSLNIAMSAETKPVVLNYRGMNVRCASFDYRSGDDSLTVTSSKTAPNITLQMADGTTVQTPSIAYSGLDSKATLRGASTAEIALPSDEKDQPPQKMQARWEKSCILTLLHGADDEMSVERALLEGDVIVVHPQLGLRCDTLDLGLLQGEAGKIGLEDLKADGKVRCSISEASGSKRDISCDHLVATQEKQGKRIVIEADGDVSATGDEEELVARRLRLTFAAERGAKPHVDAAANPGMLSSGEFQLESLLAQQDVKLSRPDGGNASGDHLQLTVTPEGAVAELLGQPGASISDGRNTLIGPHIKFEQALQRVSVNGPGKLDAILEASATQAGRPQRVQVVWDSSLAFDGKENTSHVTGHVNVTTREADGTQLQLAADRMIVEMEDPPREAKIADRPEKLRQTPDFEAMGDKLWRRVILSGEAHVESMLEGDEESRYRRLTLLAPEIQYEPISGYALVPSKGRILLEDTLKDEPEARADEARALGNLQGATAIQWEEKLEFTPQNNEAILSGGVLVVHQPPQAPEPTMRLEAGRATLRFAAPSETPTTGPGGEAPKLSFDMSTLKLTALAAEDGVKISLSQVSMEGSRTLYDASNELLTAQGSEHQPVQLFDQRGLSRGSFLEVVWNMRTEQVDRMRDVQAQVRR